MSNERSLSQRLAEIDRRIIFAVLFIAILVAVLRPIGLPVALTKPTSDYYNYIEKLPTGSVVVVECDMSSGNYAVLGVQMVDTLNQLVRKGARVIFTTFGTSEGPPLAVLGVSQSDLKDKKYGVDYVILPFVTGEEAALAQFLKSFRSVITSDIYGTTFANLPVMTGVDSYKDIAVWTTFIGGGSWAGFEGVVRQVSPYKLPLLGGWFGVLVSGYIPYYTSGIALGYLNDLRGAAEYESLLNRPGRALASTDAIAFAYVILLLFMVLGNLAVLARRGKKKGVN